MGITEKNGLKINTKFLDFVDSMTFQNFCFEHISGEMLNVNDDQLIKPNSYHLFEGLGMPIKGEEGRFGNLIVKYVIKYPPSLTGKQKAGILKLFDSSYSQPLNIGSDEQVSINQMAKIIMNIANISELEFNYQLDKPKGVRGRSSNNFLCYETLKWRYKVDLDDGLKKTYDWIFDTISNNNPEDIKFKMSSISE